MRPEMRPDIQGALVLRPEPGNAETTRRLRATGVEVIAEPLFAVAPVAWRVPDPAGFDALLLTSANAPRHAGEGLARLVGLPVLAVGKATAAAARARGLDVVLTGEHDAAPLAEVARERGFARLLHLAGRDRIALPGVEAVVVYRSEVLPVPPGAAAAWAGHVALLHSIRAAQRFAALVDLDGVDRAAIGLAAIAPPVLAAAGEGWAATALAERPADAALVAAAVALIDPPGRGVDKRGR